MNIDAMTSGFITAALWADCQPLPTCPDCGRSITLQPSGWWSHDDGTGLINRDCWRLSMDGPRDESGGLQHLTPTDELRAKARDLCERFLAAADDADVQAFMDAYGDPEGGEPEEYIGHTFYLEAAGHGVSFTDRAWRDDDPMTVVCQRLHAVAKQFPEVEHLSIVQIDDETAGL